MFSLCSGRTALVTEVCVYSPGPAVIGLPQWLKSVSISLALQWSDCSNDWSLSVSPLQWSDCPSDWSLCLFRCSDHTDLLADFCAHFYSPAVVGLPNDWSLYLPPCSGWTAPVTEVYVYSPLPWSGRTAPLTEICASSPGPAVVGLP